MKGNLAVAVVAAVLMATNATVAMAQAGATAMNGTEDGGAVGGLDELVGVDPTADICTSNGPNETDAHKILYFYNIGTKKFLNIGDTWGTHAALNTSPHSLFLERESIYSSGIFYLESNLSGSGAGSYMGIVDNDVYMDRGNSDKENCKITFEKGDGYSKRTRYTLLI